MFANSPVLYAIFVHSEHHSGQNQKYQSTPPLYGRVSQPHVPQGTMKFGHKKSACGQGIILVGRTDQRYDKKGTKN
jgi:hypothetical protein